MIIADELDLPLDKVIVTLADARPELLLEPADRRLELDALDLHAGPGRGRDRRGQRCSTRPPSNSGVAVST